MIDQSTNYNYCPSLIKYQRRKSHEVKVGPVGIGGDNPIRIQSMTTVDTMDTAGSVQQAIRMINAGCEFVRITAPSLKEAENLKNIKTALHKEGYTVPLVADIHFTPNAAEMAARIVEKVRINPGNYADKKKFQVHEYTDSAYQEEIDRIRDRFTPLVKICKEHGTAMRIGTNHGSLSDRIMSRYGDTPLGMVESALEFLRICEDLNYYDVVLSMKASNTQVMVQAYRLLVQKLDEENFIPYPLHLGVTEAGEGEDGRIKSSVGIGTLLEDGLGDTVRVSLTEDPEFEIPVAKMLVDRYADRIPHEAIPEMKALRHNPFQYRKRVSEEVGNIGGNNVPRVLADFSHITNLKVQDFKSIGHFYLPEPDKWKMNDLGCDYVYLGQQVTPFMLPNGLKAVIDFTVWDERDEHCYPLLTVAEYMSGKTRHRVLNFLAMTIDDFSSGLLAHIRQDETLVLVIYTHNKHAMPALRWMFNTLEWESIDQPVIIKRSYDFTDENKLQLYAATDMGGLLIDGYGDGVMISTDLLGKNVNKESLIPMLNKFNNIAFAILQAARTRMSKTEYISCPSCGRTLFDLQETTAMIRKRTDHLKGIKIGIMGCIVNGPGEMADADYGYVGSGKGKITLYKGQEVVKRGVPSEDAVDELIEIIKADGRWVPEEAVEQL